MGLAQAGVWAGLCLGLALAVLGGQGGAGQAALCLGGLALYNGLYTPLKRRTPLAILVGGLAGALPPMLGWAAAGGGLLDLRCLLLGSIFYLWQVPHFGLLARMHRADFAAAGFPLGSLAEAGAWPRLPLGAWLAGYCALLLLLPALGLVSHAPARLMPLLAAVALAGGAGLVMKRARLGFRLVNLSLALVLAGLALGALIPAA
jgi:protoheme IX farnesyltransferase